MKGHKLSTSRKIEEKNIVRKVYLFLTDEYSLQWESGFDDFYEEFKEYYK